VRRRLRQQHAGAQAVGGRRVHLKHVAGVSKQHVAVGNNT
jgi:hypothetical protein